MGDRKTESGQDYSSYTPEDLIRAGIETKIPYSIRVGNIAQEAAIIDFAHVQVLKASMARKRGQISPVSVRARLNEEGELVYDVIDGFHRVEAKRLVEKELGVPQRLDAIVVFGCSDSEFFDLRVTAASSSKSVRFPRMAGWMKKSFESTEWKNFRLRDVIANGGLTLSQVFTLAYTDSSGRNLGLATEEVNEIKEWAIGKAEQWGKEMSTLINDMRTVEASAPELVQRVRTGGGGHGGRGVFTKARLNALARNLPGEWEIQIALADLSVERNILAGDLDFLAWSYAFAKEAGDVETMEKILKSPELLLDPPRPLKNESEDPISNTIVQRYPIPRKPQRRRRGQGKVASRSQKMLSPQSVTDLPGATDRFDTATPAEQHVRPNDIETLSKHSVPEILKRLMGPEVQRDSSDNVLLYTSYGELKIDFETKRISLNSVWRQLTDPELQIMNALSALEGIPVSREILLCVGCGDDLQAIADTASSLRNKIATLSLRAANELRISEDGNKYSWLAEESSE